MTPKTDEQIKAEVATLEKMKPFIPAYDAFGGYNRAKVEAALQAMRDNMEDWEVDDMEDSGDWTSEEAAAARDAVWWMNGEESMSPSQSWEPVATGFKP